MQIKWRIGGGNLLVAFYWEYLRVNPELFVVAEDEKKQIIGFCMGYYMDQESPMQLFLRHNRLKILWKTICLMLVGNKETWNKMLSRFKHTPSLSDWKIVNDKYEYILDNERGDLLSVCLLPLYRGKGYSQDLMEAYLDSMKSHGIKTCLLSVKTDNLRARRYYERNGFELYRTRSAEGLTYIKLL